MSEPTVYDGRCRACYHDVPHNAAEHRTAISEYLAVEKDHHAAAAGALCHEGSDGCCLTCGVEMTLCNVCEGIGYHRENCAAEGAAL